MAAAAPPPGTRLLVKGWEPAEPGPTGPLPGPVAVLATPRIRALADRLAAALPGAEVLEPGQLADGPEPGRFRACVDLTGCESARPGVSGAQDDPAAWLPWVQRFVARNREPVVLLGVTRGLETPEPGGTAVGLAGAARAGLYRMLQSEYTRVRSRHVDLDPLGDDGSAVAQIVAELTDTGEDPEVSLRAGRRYRAVLRESSATETETETATASATGDGAPVPFPEGQTLWITGGTGGLGLAFARHAVAHWGVRRLVLTGRTRLPERAEWETNLDDGQLGRRLRALIDLERAGARVRVLSLPLDGSATGELDRAVRAAERDLGPVGGVIHCAGFADRDHLAFVSKPADAVHAVTAPKIAGRTGRVLRPPSAAVLRAVLVGCGRGPERGRGTERLRRGQRLHGLPGDGEAARPAAAEHPVARLERRRHGGGEQGPGYLRTGLGSVTEAEGTALLDHLLAHDVGPVVLPAVVRDPRPGAPNCSCGAASRSLRPTPPQCGSRCPSGSRLPGYPLATVCLRGRWRPLPRLSSDCSRRTWASTRDGSRPTYRSRTTEPTRSSPSSC